MVVVNDTPVVSNRVQREPVVTAQEERHVYAREIFRGAFMEAVCKDYVVVDERGRRL